MKGVIEDPAKIQSHFDDESPLLDTAEKTHEKPKPMQFKMLDSVATQAATDLLFKKSKSEAD